MRGGVRVAHEPVEVPVVTIAAPLTLEITPARVGPYSAAEPRHVGGTVKDLQVGRNRREMVPYAVRDGGGGQIDTGFKAACRRAGITDFHPHDCRHTWATWLYGETGNLRQLMELGGWKSIKMVERYTHVNPDHLRSAIDALPDGE